MLEVDVKASGIRPANLDDLPVTLRDQPKKEVEEDVKMSLERTALVPNGAASASGSVSVPESSTFIDVEELSLQYPDDDESASLPQEESTLR